MAPEGAIGKENIDGRADLYSLGCTAYYLLTGQLVFDEGSGVGQVIAHAQKTPIVPSQRTELPLPPALEQIVMRLLEKEPEKRFRSAHELGRSLRAIKGVPEFCPYTAEDWWNTNLPEMTRNMDETFRPQVAARAATADAAIPAGRR